ncbi:MAG: hypothetical protein DRJ50_07685 [Actinobacteria bacterium]|nr:MAG: hypothetical protein DRJ50_07685 [Actinomycetota bacterium]
MTGPETAMCGNFTTLRGLEPEATSTEIEAGETSDFRSSRDSQE